MNDGQSLNLPNTDFPMRAELPKREPEILSAWESRDSYLKSLAKPAPHGEFVLHDGPPYANGHIHMGHALNKILKDFIVRYKTMAGYQSPFIPGWDNHGMPIEVEVAKEFRKAGKTPDRLELRRRCREYASNWVDIQRAEFKRLGVRGDWTDPYLTMSTDYEASVIKVFSELALAGYVYRGLRPILWCPTCETALAESEVEYAPHTSPSIFVRFPLKSDVKGLFDGLPTDRIHAIIWTTTPWTIPANVAIAVNPDFAYVVVEAGGDYYILARDLLDQVLKAVGIEDFTIVRTLTGRELEGTVFAHPIFDRDSPVILADFVTLTEGTGMVHIAPGHGREDFVIGRKYGLQILNIVDAGGRYTEEAGPFAGMSINQGDTAVVGELERRGNLLACGSVDHSYPHCWRCKGALIFRTTIQWFLKMDHEGLRAKILDAIGDVDWFPAESVNRITSMISNSPDWCLSRQRAWGVGIPVFYCTSCGAEIMTAESFHAVYHLVLAEGSDAWFSKEPSEILPPEFACPACGGTKFTKETDILDVWFDSGSSCRAVLQTRIDLKYPADLYLEGSDQHRGWFNRSLVIGVSTMGESPFSQCVTNGWMLDEHGRAMHKSLGNVISPIDIVNRYGADVLRLWVSSVNYFEDVRIGSEILKRISDSYRRIRNTFRFLLANLYDFDPSSDAVPYSDMYEIDRWALHRLQLIIRDATAGYDAYEFFRVYHAVQNFMSVDISAFYLDVSKGRLYTSAPKSVQRRSAQTAMLEILTSMVRVLAPILCFTADEVWEYIPGIKSAASVELSDFPEEKQAYVDEELGNKWEKLLDVRDQVYRRMEEARTAGAISKPLEALVILKAPPATYEFLAAYRDELAAIFIVSQVRLELSESAPGLEIIVEQAPGKRCDRCWLVLPTVGEHAVYPSLCARCAEVVTEVY